MISQQRKLVRLRNSTKNVAKHVFDTYEDQVFRTYGAQKPNYIIYFEQTVSNRYKSFLLKQKRWLGLSQIV